MDEGLAYSAVLQAHAWMCSIAVVALVPLTAFMGRYGPYVIKKRTTKWYVHAAIGAVCLLLILIGGALGLVHRNRPAGPNAGSHFIVAHGILGLTIMVVMFAQFLLGLVVFYVRPKAKSPPQNVIHRLLGVVLYIMSIADCILGFNRYILLYPIDSNAIIAWMWGFVASCIAFIAIFVVTGELLRKQDKKRRLAKRLAREEALDAAMAREEFLDVDQKPIPSVDDDEFEFDHLGDSDKDDELQDSKVEMCQESTVETDPSDSARVFL
jgi:cytochrome b561